MDSRGQSAQDHDVSADKPKVLVVDDERSVRTIAERVLKRHDIEVVSVADGDEALEVLAGDPDIDLVLLDSSMPNMSGEQVLAHMRDRGYSPQVLLSSGFGDELDRERYPNLKGQLAKPYSIRQLAARVLELLGHGS